MAERKRLPAFIVLGVVLAVTAVVVLDYWGYVIPATYTQVEVQITGFTLHDSTMYLRFRYTNPRSVRVTVLETSYSVMLNGVTLTTDTVPGPILVEGKEPAYLERTLTLPPDIGPQVQAAWTSHIWEWEFKGAMSVKTTLGDTHVNFSETSKYAPMFTP
jgi:LEA14-like dessication related protein